MSDTSTQKTDRKKDWVLGAKAFDRLLVWLDNGSDSGGESYVEMRRRLVGFFDRRNCSSPDALADETLNRAARRLEEEGAITDAAPAQYCYIVARYVFLEDLHAPERAHVSLDDKPASGKPLEQALGAPRHIDEPENDDRRLDCLEGCLKGLGAEGRELIVGYYQGTQRVKIENRRKIARRLGLTVNALSIRACRIRGRLESCVGDCVGRK